MGDIGKKPFKEDAAAFRAASLEPSKLPTDLQESRLRHMEGRWAGECDPKRLDSAGAAWHQEKFLPH